MRIRRTTPVILSNSHELRQNPTDAEVKLWRILRSHQLEGVHFRRQHAIGTYIVDFCAPGKKLIIELDGGQHLDQREYDRERTMFLEAQGYVVLRFWNHDVFENIDGVVAAILGALDVGE